MSDNSVLVATHDPSRAGALIITHVRETGEIVQATFKSAVAP
jgi:hypothetical protein